MKKTTLTISVPSACMDALIQDARISGRTLLAIHAQPDSRRSTSQADARAETQAKPETTVQTELETPVQAELETPAQTELETPAQAELETGIQTATEPAEDESSNPRDEHTVISWNPGSFASTKAALIEAETALGGTINEAVVFIDPQSTGGMRLSELSLGQIEAATTTWITGYAQLLRELGRRFAERGSGLILVVLLSSERDPLGAMAAGALEALACTMAARTGEAYRLFTIRDESGQPELLARYLLKVLDEPPRDSSKLLRHSGRINLFGK